MIYLWKHVMPGDMIVSKTHMSTYLCISKVQTAGRLVRFRWYHSVHGLIEGSDTNETHELEYYVLVKQQHKPVQ